MRVTINNNTLWQFFSMLRRCPRISRNIYFLTAQRFSCDVKNKKPGHFWKRTENTRNFQKIFIQIFTRTAMLFVRLWLPLLEKKWFAFLPRPEHFSTMTLKAWNLGCAITRMIILLETHPFLRCVHSVCVFSDGNAGFKLKHDRATDRWTKPLYRDT